MTLISRPWKNALRGVNIFWAFNKKKKNISYLHIYYIYILNIIIIQKFVCLRSLSCDVLNTNVLCYCYVYDSVGRAFCENCDVHAEPTNIINNYKINLYENMGQQFNNPNVFTVIIIFTHLWSVMMAENF